MKFHSKANLVYLVSERKFFAMRKIIDTNNDASERELFFDFCFTLFIVISLHYFLRGDVIMRT